MIDTHSHLYVEDFFHDFYQVLNQSKRNGVKEIWFPSINSLYHSRMIYLQTKNSKLIKLMSGIHPCYINKRTIDFELEKMKLFINENKCIAIGEIGLDLSMNQENFQLQKKAFIEQIRFAKEKNLPIILHARESISQVIKILKNEKFNLIQKGIFHCFSGNLSEAIEIVNLGFLIGINGMITFKNNNIANIINNIPLKYIVLETDAPYLAPEPFRGTRNASYLMLNIVKKLSLIYKVSIQEIITITTNNAKKLISL